MPGTHEHTHRWGARTSGASHSHWQLLAGTAMSKFEGAKLQVQGRSTWQKHLEAFTHRRPMEQFASLE